MKQYLLGIDIGTSACKAALFGENGQAAATADASYPVSYPHPGWAEQQPEDWWQGACAAIRAVLEKSGVDPAEIAGVGVDGQSWSAVAVDADGQVLCPTPIWTDTRAQAQCGEICRVMPEEEWFRVSGNAVKPGYTLPKILWYRENLPEVFKRTRTVLQSNSFIVYRLTGVLSQDTSQGYGYSCFDMHKGVWREDLFSALGLSPELLPPLYRPQETVGFVTAEAAAQCGLKPGTPVAAGGLDAACGTLGAGVVAPGQTQEQGGQAEGMSICTKDYAADPRLILGIHATGDSYLLQGGTTGGGGALKWLREQVCPDLSFAQMSDLAASVPPGSDGVIFLPYMAGERSPLWNPQASGVFFGLSYARTRAHLIRAVMEGVACSLRHNLDTAAQAGARPQVLRAMGGSANSLVWTQIKADLTHCRMEVAGSDTATAWGAALLAGVGTGLYDGFAAAVEKTVQVRRTHEPDAGLFPVYDRLYARYLELSERLAPMMTE